jgi:hypothetical protein
MVEETGGPMNPDIDQTLTHGQQRLEPASPERLSKAGPLIPTLAGYDHLELIAHGSTALVFRAIQTRLNRPVAIKVITVDGGSLPVNTERELATTVALSSQPHIVSIIDTGQTPDDRPYIVMEYCEGGSYAQILRNDGPMPIDDVVDVGVKIGEALHAAHQSGIIHRDVKPSNILYSRFGPALTDFGIARAPDELSSTVAREMMTPSYASPEALMQKTQTGLSDVYSLASTMWTLLVGRPPFADSTAQPKDMHLFAHRVLHEPLPTMPRKDVPTWLVNELTRAMSKKPSDRHASALEFTQALRRGALGLASAATKMASRTGTGTSRPTFVFRLRRGRVRRAGARVQPVRDPAAGPMGTHPSPPRGRRQRFLLIISLTVAALVVGGFTTTQLINDDPVLPDQTTTSAASMQSTTSAPGGAPTTTAAAAVSVPVASVTRSLPATRNSGASGRLVAIGGTCVGLSTAAALSGSRVQLAACDSRTANQRWTYAANKTLRNGGLCLSPENKGKTNATKMTVAACDGSAAQQWNQQDEARLQNADSQLCLHIPGDTTAVGAVLQLFTCWGGSVEEQFLVPPASRDTPASKPPGPQGAITIPTGKCLAPQGGKAAVGVGIVVADCAAGGAKDWVVDPSGKLWNGGYCAVPFNNYAGSGALVSLASCDGSPMQRWSTDAGKHLVNASTKNCMFDNGNINGFIVMFGCFATDQQSFTLPTVPSQ